MTQVAKRVQYQGFTWDLMIPSNVDTEIAEGRPWDKEVGDWICTHLKPGMVAVDAGANFGYFTLLMARQVGRQGHVVAFEPAPVFYDRLLGHVALNGITNVTCEQLALSDQGGPASCVLNAGPYFSSATIAHNAVQAPNVWPTQCVTLDAYWKRERLDFLKVDVDGHEGKLLCGAANILRKLRPILAIELTVGPAGQDALSQLLAAKYCVMTHKVSSVDADYLLGIRGAGTINALALPADKNK